MEEIYCIGFELNCCKFLGEFEKCNAESFECEYKTNVNPWVLGAIHPQFGEVVMMGTTGGEKYRWFQKDNLTSMIPLSFLREK